MSLFDPRPGECEDSSGGPCTLFVRGPLGLWSPLWACLHRAPSVLGLLEKDRASLGAGAGRVPGPYPRAWGEVLGPTGLVELGGRARGPHRGFRGARPLAGMGKAPAAALGSGIVGRAP